MTIKVVIRDCVDVDGVTTYDIVVTNESGREWKIHKRYKDFQELDREIVADGTLCKKKGVLPPTGTLGIRKMLRVGSFMKARRDGLDVYMRKLCDQVSTLEQNPVLHRFLQYSDHQKTGCAGPTKSSGNSAPEAVALHASLAEEGSRCDEVETRLADLHSDQQQPAESHCQAPRQHDVESADASSVEQSQKLQLPSSSCTREVRVDSVASEQTFDAEQPLGNSECALPSEHPPFADGNARNVRAMTGHLDAGKDCDDSDFGLSDEQLRDFNWTVDKERSMTLSEVDNSRLDVESDFGISDEQLDTFNKTAQGIQARTAEAAAHLCEREAEQLAQEECSQLQSQEIESKETSVHERDEPADDKARLEDCTSKHECIESRQDIASEHISLIPTTLRQDEIVRSVGKEKETAEASDEQTLEKQTLSQQQRERLQDIYVIPSQEFQEHKIEVVDKRLTSLESLSVVSALIAGFAINDSSNFNSSSYPWPWMYVYAIAIGAVISTMMYVSLLAVLTIVGTKRIAAWDDTFKFKKPCGEDIFKNENYGTLMRMIGKADKSDWTYTKEKYNKQLGATEKMEAPDQGRVLRLPLSYEFLKYMTDGSYSPIGVGMYLFPASIVLYSVAIIMNIAKGDGNNVTLTVMTALFVPLGIYMWERISHLTDLMAS